MAKFLQILEGRDAASARPVFATADERLLAAVNLLLSARLGAPPTAEDIRAAVALLDAEPAQHPQ